MHAKNMLRFVCRTAYFILPTSVNKCIDQHKSNAKMKQNNIDTGYLILLFRFLDK